MYILKHTHIYTYFKYMLHSEYRLLELEKSSDFIFQLSTDVSAAHFLSIYSLSCLLTLISALICVFHYGFLFVCALPN